MPAIYQPRGKALEYSPLALNLYKGCSHGCAYCFAPSATFTPREQFHSADHIRPRPDILAQAEKDAKKLAGDHRDVLLSFTSDVYQPAEERYQVTREALLILKKHQLHPTILTKGGALARRDFDILQSIPGAAFAVTLTCRDAKASLDWEPGAALPEVRIENLREAHKAGIRTWVSFEPVLYPAQVLDMIRETAPFVDLFKVGKLNYHPHAKTIDWPKFRVDVVALLKDTGKPYIIKKDLRLAK